MKKLFPIIAIVLLLFSVLSCDSGLKRVEDGNVNYYIYPYLKFTLSNDLTYYEASVVEGAKLTSVSIPGFHHTDFGPMPVKVFKGFENQEDAVYLKTVYIDVNVDRISDDAFDHASSLESVVTTGTSDGQYWAKLPPSLTRNGYHFHGWKVGDIIYDGGSTVALDPDYPVAVPYFIELEHFDAVESTCSEEGNIEYWKCPECGKLFTDSYAENSVNSVTVPPTGHLYPLVHKVAVEPTCQREGNLEYWRCDRCMETFTDETGTEVLENYILAKVPHESDGETYCSETVHYHKCRWCGIVMDEEAHTFGEWIIDKDATEHEAGLKHAVCTELGCGYVKEAWIPEHDHFDYEPVYKVKVDATCLEGAYYLEKCGNPDCGTILRIDIEEEKAKGHTGTYHEYVAPTCTSTGTKAHLWCDVCKAPYENQWSIEPMDTIVLEKIPHEFSTDWEYDDSTHYHVCTICETAKSDEEKHTYKNVVAEAYLKYSSTCQHANLYIESCECGKHGSKLFEDGSVSAHSYTVYMKKDDSVHVLVCQWCKTAVKENSEEKHSFVEIETGKQCEKCKYIVPFSEGGFKPILVDKSPLGRIEEVSREGDTFTFKFIDGKTGYPVTSISWDTDGIPQSPTNGQIFTVTAPYRQTYYVRCSYGNGYGVGSKTIQFHGGM